MSLTQILNYDTAGNFAFDSTRIQFNGSNASLKLIANPGLTFSQALTSSAGFTFNATNTAIAAGVLSQKNQAPATLAAYIAWDSFLNVNYGTDGSTVTPFNGAAINAGVLDLTGSVNKYVQLPSAYVMGNIGTIAFSYKPNYSGNPSGNQIMYGNIGPNNYFALLHSQSVGHLQLTVTNSTGTAIINANNFGTWSPVSGTTYTIVLQFDITNGATKLFINGVQFGSTVATTGVRTASASAWVGSDGTPADGNPNFNISGFALYTSIVGPTGLTPLPDNNYIGDTITFPTFTYPGIGSIVAFTGFTTAGDVNAPGYILNGLYWNGMSWVSSNGSYAQSSPKATVATNIAALPNNNTLTIQVITTTSTSQMSITGPLVVTYSGQIYPQTNPTLVNNSGIDADLLLAFAATTSSSGSDAVQFALIISGQDQYWNGSAWVASSGYGQSNIASDILANLAALNLTGGAAIQLKVYLHSASGLTTPNITNATISYDFREPVVGEPSRCLVYAFLNDIIGLLGPQAKTTLTVELKQSFVYGSRIIAAYTRIFTVDVDGYTETTAAYLKTPDATAFDGIVESQTNSLSPYKFTISYTSGDLNKTPLTIVQDNVQVPNQISVNLATLLTL